MAENTPALKAKDVLPASPEELREIMAENMGEDVSPFDLEQVGIPTGGGLKFTIPTLTGEDSVADVTGIITHWQNCRAYWPGAFAGDTPPICASEDGVIGVGTPGGRCAECPFAQFGSDPDESGGQACKQMRRLYIARPDHMLPLVLTLPPTSIGPCRKYMMLLTSAKVPYWGVVTKITLTQAKNKGGISYAKTVFAAAAELPAAVAEQSRAYGDEVRAMLKARKDLQKVADLPLEEDDDPITA